MGAEKRIADGGYLTFHRETVRNCRSVGVKPEQVRHGEGKYISEEWPAVSTSTVSLRSFRFSKQCDTF